MTERISRAVGPYGRGTSFGLPTSGHKGWIPCMFKSGTNNMRPPQEGYKNVLDNREYIPPGGWNDAPPGPTGEPIPLHSTDAYRKGYDAIRWNK
jgi:hypothetical protein